MSEKDRLILWEPGFDCIRFECKHGSKRCKPNGGGSHGRHGMQIRFVLKGDEGAVQFVLYTGWLPEPEGFSQDVTTMPADLGYHSPTPQYADHPQFDCEFVSGGKCYYDGSSLNAEHPWKVLCNEGIEAFWVYLEGYYATCFHDAPFPEATAYRLALREEVAS